ncbi:MAG TPA: HEAT repeat domain-containing protein [Solirubrobacteraceae bacterium]|nr:HEAT repeat domain-containing protein [Solirubrobacteraceae bacterium]
MSSAWRRSRRLARGRLSEADLLALLEVCADAAEERALVVGLGEAGGDRSVVALRERARSSPDQGVREQAAIALNKRGTEAAQEAMISLLDAPDRRIVSFAAWMLARHSRNSAQLARRARPGLHAAVPTLAGAVDDPRAVTRRMAIRALLLIGTPEARSELERAAARLTCRQRRWVRRALRHLPARERAPIS